MGILREILKFFRNIIFVTVLFAIIVFILMIFMPAEVMYAFELLREIFT